MQYTAILCSTVQSWQGQPPPLDHPPKFPESFLQHVLFRCSCGTCRLSCSVCAAGGHFLLLCRSVGSGEVSSFSPPGRPAVWRKQIQGLIRDGTVTGRCMAEDAEIQLCNRLRLI